MHQHNWLNDHHHHNRTQTHTHKNKRNTMRKCSTASDFVFILDFGNRHTKNSSLKQYLHRFDRFECYCYYTKLFIMAAELE